MQITLIDFPVGADCRDIQTLLRTVKDWPREIYDIAAVIVAVRAELDKAASTSSTISSAPGSKVLMECLAEL
jgi:phage gp29-like protein